MALKSKVFKAELQVSDFDRNYYETHALALAQHPSETDERLMVRVLAFTLHADSALALGRAEMNVECRRYLNGGAAQAKFAASFTSPEPSYCATCG